MSANAAPISRREFWVAVATVLASVFATLWTTFWQFSGTRAEIKANQLDADRARCAELLSNVTKAVNNVCGAMQAHGSMYFEIRDCLAKGTAAKDCWTREYSFDMDASQLAWNDFDAQIANADIILDAPAERLQIEIIRQAKTSHLAKLESVRAPETAIEAEAAIQLMTDTQSTLQGAVRELAVIVADRLHRSG